MSLISRLFGGDSMGHKKDTPEPIFNRCFCGNTSDGISSKYGYVCPWHIQLAVDGQHDQLAMEAFFACMPGPDRPGRDLVGLSFVCGKTVPILELESGVFV